MVRLYRCTTTALMSAMWMAVSGLAVTASSQVRAAQRDHVPIEGTDRDLPRSARAGHRDDTPGDPARRSAKFAPPSIMVVHSTAPRCALPPIPRAAHLLLVGAYESDTLSSVVVGGQETETNLADVVVEPGTTPLYIVLTTYKSMIWRFTGDVHRIEHVVVASFMGEKLTPVLDKRLERPPYAAVSKGMVATSSVVAPPLPSFWDPSLSASGVIGVPRSRVTIAAIRCLPYFSEPEESQKAINALEESSRRKPDVVVASHLMRRVSLPSGAVSRSARGAAQPPTGFDPNNWGEAIRFWPGGLEHVDRKQVVAVLPVEPYEVLPAQMGIAQLIGAGALEPIGSADDYPRTYRVVRKIKHFPPSMGGAHSVKLIIAKGVPIPPGDPEHSCVILEETGQKVSSADLCR